MNFYWWSHLEAEACHKPHNSIESLKKSIQRASKKIDKAEVKFAVSKFRPRFEAVIAAKGGHIE
jgi:hypothetical protein